MTDQKPLDHQHVLIKAFVNKPPIKEDHLNQWMAETVEAIRMKIVFGPNSKYVDAVGNKGLTGSVNIETSHLAIHVWDEPSPAMIQMDVYSCSCFTPETILKKLDEFELVDYELMWIDRNDGFQVKEHRVPKG